MKRALFLDRDGVINVDHAYVHKPDDFEFIDGIFELVAAANRVGYLTIVITNQAGIGRGYYTEADFEKLTAWMKQQFLVKGAHIDDVYYCPHHPESAMGNYLKDCDCRKPKPGMLLKAMNEHSIDMANSIFIGDKESDMIAGRAAGINCLVMNNPSNEKKFYITISDIKDAIKFLTQ